MKSLFEYLNYKSYIKDLIKAQGRGSVAKLAQAAGCNRTYLSQCLNSKVQLLPDHIIGISGFLNLSDDEQEFLLLLLLFERSISKEAQNKFHEKMDKLRQANLVLSRKIAQKSDSDELSDSQKANYYSSWKYAAIHTLTSIPEFQSVSKISKKLNLSENEVHLCLKALKEAGLIYSKDGRWVHTGKNIHISPHSNHILQNHLNWRLKALDNLSNKLSLHYTTVFSLTKNDLEKLKHQLIEFISNQRDFIHNSGTEEMFCFCCDLFQPAET